MSNDRSPCTRCGKDMATCLADVKLDYICQCAENDPYRQLPTPEADHLKAEARRKTAIAPRNLRIASAVAFAIMSGEFHRTRCAS